MTDDGSPAKPAERKAATGAGGASGTTLRLAVPEMDCPSCAGKVGHALDSVPGVADHDLRATTGTAVVHLAADASVEAVVEAVEAAGYTVTDVEGDGTTGGQFASGESPADGQDQGHGNALDDVSGSVWRSPRGMATLVAAVLLVAGVVLEFGLHAVNGPVATVLGSTLTLADVLLLGAIIAGGRVIVRNGYYSLRSRSLDIDLLMSVAILAATGVSLAVPTVSLYIEGASIAVLFNVAELLERRAVNRARASLAELSELAPSTATVRRNGEPVEVPADSVAVGEIVLVGPGERIPVDGTVTAGDSAVNEAPITGESVPVDKGEGDEVFAGTIAETGYLEVETTATADETTIAHVIELVRDASAKKSDREQFVERFSRYYTPVVVTGAVLTAAVPPLLFGAPWPRWFLRGIALLVIACPCAFVISTPVTVVSGITSAARNGVLIKGGRHLEAMGAVRAVAFDKTGTLTRGELAVTDVIPLNGNDEADLLRCARSLEARSEHPIAAAITAHADEAAVDSRAVDDFESLPGRGVRADLDGVTHYAGTPALFADLGFDLSHAHLTTDGGVVHETRSRCPDREDCLDLLGDTLPRLEADGKTIVLVGTADELEGVIAVADEVRPEAAATVAALRDAGIERVVMLTGDNEGTARAIAGAVGIDDFRAGLLPEEKIAAIDELADTVGPVAMVGDGINDAPALATADVGIAMGAAGTDTALETADVALMGDDLDRLPYLYRLSNAATGVIRQNVWSSLGVKAILAVGVPLGYVSVILAILAGDVGMSTLVTANASRLARLSPVDLADASTAGPNEGSATPAPGPELGD